MKQMAHYPIGSAEQIPEGQHRVFEIKGKSVVVYNVQGEFFALLNYCPHQGAKMCTGKVSGTMLPSDVYEYRLGRLGEIVRCPWHGWEFDIKTGKSLVRHDVRLLRYEVVLEDGMLSVSI
jgi:nitrite reductase/ring-hydroxylating ferredoxin subunit